MTFLDILNIVTLTILSLGTIRSIIASFGLVDRNAKYARLFYNTYDNDLTKKVLADLGFDHDNVIKNIKRAHIPKHLNSTNKLITVLINTIQEYDTIKTYGEGTPEPTKYYLNTMEAVHNEVFRDYLAQAAFNIISLKLEIFPNVFIIPKEGNSYLSFEMKKQNPNCFILLVKSDDHHSYLKASEGESISVNIEGIHQLLEHAHKNPEKIYTPVVFDCNCSGGSMIIHAGKYFNSLLSSLKTYSNIKPVSEAVVLFRSDTTVKIDEKAKSVGINVYRYFDLTEEIKENMNEIKKRYGYIDCYDKKHENIIRQISEKMNSMQLMKVEESK